MYDTFTKVYNLTSPIEKKIAKSVARGNRKTALRYCVSYSKAYLEKVIPTMICKELKAMCSSNVNSTLQNYSTNTMMTFKWDQLLTELRIYAPLLFAILQQCTANKTAIIGMCASLLLKSRCNRMSLVQNIISLILYAGHSSKLVNILRCLYALFYSIIYM